MICVTIQVVGTLLIDTGDIYCFGTGLVMSMAKDIYQYRHLSKTVNLLYKYLK